MSNSLGMVHRAMSADADLVRLIAENIANAQTAGYQRKLGIQQITFENLSDPSIARSTTIPSALKIANDSAPGTLSQTGEPLDIALSSTGSLVVTDENGESHVRGGRFHINAEGVLVTQQGQIVQGESGSINFGNGAIDSNAIHISADGTIAMAGVDLGRLQIQSSGADKEIELPRVMQGFIETSNVSPVTEMLKLMEVMRHFEATQKVARSYDDLMQQAISDIGKI